MATLSSTITSIKSTLSHPSPSLARKFPKCLKIVVGGERELVIDMSTKNVKFDDEAGKPDLIVTCDEVVFIELFSG